MTNDRPVDYMEILYETFFKSEKVHPTYLILCPPLNTNRLVLIDNACQCPYPARLFFKDFFAMISHVPEYFLLVL